MPRTQIKIFTVLNGWVIQAGCQLLVYTDRDTLMKDFADFTNDPERTERRLLASAINRKVTFGDVPTANEATQAPPPQVWAGGDAGPHTATGLAGNYPAPPVPASSPSDLHEILNQRF